MDRHNVVRHVLKNITEDKRQIVLDSWMQSIGEDSDLAVGILLWARNEMNLPEGSLQRILISAAESRLVLRRSIRDDLRDMSLAGLDLPSRLSTAFVQDRANDKEKLVQQELNVRARQNYLNGLSEKSFPERVAIILADQTIKYQDWRDSWSICTDSDLEKLDAASVQDLIDLLNANMAYRWSAALQKLTDRRHLLRLAAMEKFRVAHRTLLPEQQLSLLVHDPSVPIGHYPKELAEHVSTEWLNMLTAEERSRFLEMLSTTRLRIWMRVRKRLSS
jgi:hypothetical protein